jgi:DNA-nicking Smr family endonuclease
MARRRAPTADETRLWRSAMRDVQPLHGPLPSLDPPPPPSPSSIAAPATVASTPPPKTAPIMAPSPPAPRKPNGVDGKTMRQLSRGERTVEAVIDLHGMTLEAAHGALRRFIAQQAQAERRCLLVITGKGGTERPGRLRREVPLWLADWKPPVLTVVQASPRHGGAGALYVLLQRRR